MIMRFLLDTCALIWSITGYERLEPVYRLFTNPANDFFYSPMSIWEIAIKYEKGKTNISSEIALEYAIKQDFYELPVSTDHILQVNTINYPEGLKHRDPFDNVLVAQAKGEGLMLMTGDEVIKQYRESCIFGI